MKDFQQVGLWFYLQRIQMFEVQIMIFFPIILVLDIRTWLNNIELVVMQIPVAEEATLEDLLGV